jgi:regulator of extracellular matrix RemA (YlzA/DUF370 family)
MQVEFLHVGFENILAANRVLAIVTPNSAPVKRMMREAAARGLVIDMTNGRKTKAVIVLDSGHIALAALQPETIAGRLDAQRSMLGPGNANTPMPPAEEHR